jgi:hypothetical protein
MSKSILFYHELALTELIVIYVPFPEPGPPSTKNTSAGYGASILALRSLIFN